MTDIQKIDFSKMEARALAGNANSQDFNDMLDHCKQRASEMFGIPYKEVTREQRSKAKLKEFGKSYGKTTQKGEV